ncbi:hypothetical protein BDA96_08G014200 [Sorghum bicolor]|uniref:Uncharacterized protein n=2 Tax=Sorghum bicolor TaxID=4558 RepID=A0A921QDK6_SORBI|nr:uncharacterized protein LOC110429591 [Sorghum bicolor]KAG0519758.1 hypothetical protein BDA96_08G014200 [Sorghum bicolor]KXG22823.1 hypothetical protein SORBI_3008G013000 [Sorghum bicolor]|eukprot:XP_021301412.1 uncharacterized protein LOC110429591 [Sorghum bicolor]
MAAWNRSRDVNSDPEHSGGSWRPPLPRPDNGDTVRPVPLWEREFCRNAYDIPWQTFCEKKRFIKILFKNVMDWDDSGAHKNFLDAKERFRAKYFGEPYEDPVENPDLYIDEVDHHCEVNPELVAGLDKIAGNDLVVDLGWGGMANMTPMSWGAPIGSLMPPGWGQPVPNLKPTGWGEPANPTPDTAWAGTANMTPMEWGAPADNLIPPGWGQLVPNLKPTGWGEPANPTPDTASAGTANMTSMEWGAPVGNLIPPGWGQPVPNLKPTGWGEPANPTPDTACGGQRNQTPGAVMGAQPYSTPNSSNNYLHGGRPSNNWQQQGVDPGQTSSGTARMLGGGGGGGRNRNRGGGGGGRNRNRGGGGGGGRNRNHGGSGGFGSNWNGSGRSEQSIQHEGQQRQRTGGGMQRNHQDEGQRQMRSMGRQQQGQRGRRMEWRPVQHNRAPKDDPAA